MVPSHKRLILQFILLFSCFTCLPIYAAQSLPVEEVIIGVSRIHKKELKKHSLYQQHKLFLFMPVKKWMYQYGKKRFKPEKISNDIVNIRKKYEARIAKAPTEKKREMLLHKMEKLVNIKEEERMHGNFLMRKGEKPQYYDLSQIDRNKKIFSKYFRSKGYLYPEITSQVEVRKDKVRVSYYINTQYLYTISSTNLHISDPSIRSLVLQDTEESFIKIGNSYQEKDFDKERERIVTLLSNNGYFNFDEQCIYFTAEELEDHTLAISTIISKPHSAIPHHKTKIARVVVDLTYSTDKKKNNNVIIKECQGISFLLSSEKYPLEDFVRKIALRPGEFYDKSKLLETSERLYSLSLFESITVLPKMEAGELVVYIHARPCARFILQTELGVKWVGLQSGGLRPTLKLIPTIRPRSGLGITEIEASMDRAESSIEEYNSFYQGVYGLRFKYKAPRFIGLAFLSPKNKLNLEMFNPSTAMELGGTLKEAASFREVKIDMDLNYNWCSHNKYIKYKFSPCAMQLSKKNNKSDTLDLTESEKSFLTSIGFSTFLGNAMDTNYKWMLFAGIEGGGLYENIFLIKKIFSKQFHFYKYIKLDLICRYIFKLIQDTKLVLHSKIGIIKSLEKEGKVPVEKRYGVGGFGSVRGWELGQLGPGSYVKDEIKGENKEQEKEGRRKGDLLIQGNLELRQKLIGYLEGALFLDVGNTWRISNYGIDDRKRSGLFNRNNFYKELAVGGGIGVRLNFYDVFVLCADFATQLHKPYKLQRGEFPTFFFSIGYPF